MGTNRLRRAEKRMSLLPGNSAATEDWEKSVRSNSGNCKKPGGELHNSVAQMHPDAFKCSICERLCRHSDRGPDSPLERSWEKLARTDGCVLVSMETSGHSFALEGSLARHCHHDNKNNKITAVNHTWFALKISKVRNVIMEWPKKMYTVYLLYKYILIYFIINLKSC